MRTERRTGGLAEGVSLDVKIRYFCHISLLFATSFAPFVRAR
nr:MAG TPA: hypothetical protein [Bacteriophage sp.]